MENIITLVTLVTIGIVAVILTPFITLRSTTCDHASAVMRLFC